MNKQNNFNLYIALFMLFFAIIIGTLIGSSYKDKK